MGGDVYNSIKNSEGFKHCYDKKFLNKRLDMQRNMQINQNYCEYRVCQRGCSLTHSARTPPARDRKISWGGNFLGGEFLDFWGQGIFWIFF